MIDERHLTSDCLARGQLELALGRLTRPDAVSLNMFQTPVTAARARGLLDGDEADGRAQFADAVAGSLAALAELEGRSARGRQLADVAAARLVGCATPLLRRMPLRWAS